MDMPTKPSIASAGFDDRNINWRRLGDFEHFVYNVFAVDEASGIADFIARFAPNQRIFLHRHRALTNTFVVQGEHRLYRPDGSLTEVRPVGSYTSSPACDDPHAEGGGAEGAVVLYSTRGSTDGVVFDVLDDAGNLAGTLSVQDIVGLFEAQGRKAGG